MADCQAQLQDPEIAEVEAALIEEHQVCDNSYSMYVKVSYPESAS